MINFELRQWGSPDRFQGEKLELLAMLTKWRGMVARESRTGRMRCVCVFESGWEAKGKTGLELALEL